MNEYVRYMNMRYEMAECAEVTRQGSWSDGTGIAGNFNGSDEKGRDPVCAG